MAELVNSYFTTELERVYSDPALGVNFVSMETVPYETRYNAGIPEEKNNLYIDLNSTVTFAEDSQVIPTPEELYAIFEEAMGPSFIVNIVWQAPNTIWISAYEAVLGSSEEFRNPEQLDIIPAQGGKNAVPLTSSIDNIFGAGSATRRFLPERRTQKSLKY